MWYVYLILCEDKSLYCGSSDKPEKRFELHKLGKGAKYTRSHKPVRIVYKEEFATRSASLKREIEIKSWSREGKIRRLNLNLI
jgi:putative endonuclease